MFTPTVSHIVCMDNYGVIGNGSEMPWHIPEELKYFKGITSNHIVVMGKNTYLSIGVPLPNRINIIVSSSSEIQDKGDTHVREDLDSALALADVLAHKEQKDIFIIGGASIYEQTLPYISKAYITVLDEAIKGDGYKYYPYERLLDNYGFKLISKDNLLSTNYFNKIYTCILERRDVVTYST